MRETTFAFGPDGRLVGTLSLPVDHAGSTLGMVLFNAGVVHRVGPHRINVKLGRELARRGIPTLRFDLHGNGDSLGADGYLGYKEQVVADLCAALDALQAASGVQGFALVGFCSGALSSTWAAEHDTRVRHIVLYDAFSLQTLSSRLRFLAVRLRNHGLSPAALALYLHRLGSVFGSLSALVKTLYWRTRARHLATDDMQPSREQLVEAWRQLAARGVRVSVLAAGADFSNVNHDAQIVEALGLGPHDQAGVHTGFLPQIDHLMTSGNAQRAFIDWICADVESTLAQHRVTAHAGATGRDTVRDRQRRPHPPV